MKDFLEFINEAQDQKCNCESDCNCEECGCEDGECTCEKKNEDLSDFDEFFNKK